MYTPILGVVGSTVGAAVGGIIGSALGLGAGAAQASKEGSTKPVESGNSDYVQLLCEGALPV